MSGKRKGFRSQVRTTLIQRNNAQRSGRSEQPSGHDAPWYNGTGGVAPYALHLNALRTKAALKARVDNALGMS